MGMDALNGVNSYQSAKSFEPAQAPSIDIGSVASSMGANQNAAQKQALSHQPSEDEIKSAIKSANSRAHFGHTNAQFSYHESSRSISVKIIDSETNEVIKEIPSEETLEMISKMWELAGIMVDEKR